MWTFKGIIVCFVLFCDIFLTTVNCHVVLTFPPARKYAFDFMDNIRTPRPCGVPKGLGPVTDLKAGEKINVTWHIAYPHKGGYRLSLLDAQGNVIHQYQTSYINANNPTAQLQTITLPTTRCMNCTLQIIRQAAEWGSNCDNGQYLFWSCADINIHSGAVQGLNFCHGHPMVDGKCLCRSPYSGDHCQFKDECQYDTDCNNGKCLNTESTYFPKKQCYCNSGWFGAKCEKRSPIQSAVIDYNLYINTTLSPEYHLYHRIIKDLNEIEIIMRVKSKTWVGLGWRPASFRSGCQYFPSLPGVVPHPEPENPTGEPEPEKPNGEPEPEKPTGEPKPENPSGEPEPEKPTGEPEPENPTGEPEPEKPTGEPKPEKPTGEPEPEKPTGEPKPENPTGEPEPEKPTGEPKPENPTGEPKPENPTGEPEPEITTTKPEPEPHSCGGKVSVCLSGQCTAHLYWTFNDDTDIITFKLEAPVTENQWLGLGLSKDKSMVNTDIYTGWYTDQGITYIQDRYANSRTQPPIDEKQDIFNVSGSRVQGRTTLTFSRKRNTGDSSDEQFSDTQCLFPLFAWGPVLSTSERTIKYHTFRYNGVKEKLCIKSCPKAEPEPEKPTGEPKPENPTGEPEPENPTGEPEPEKPTGEPEPKNPTVEPEPKNPTGEPEPKNPTGEPEPERPTGEPEPEKPTGEPEPENPTGEPEPEGEGEPGSCGAPPRGFNDTTGDTPHHMDCVDMVIGSAKGQLSRIGDYYSRDRSTPERDEFYGGKDDLTAGFGFEDNDGYTTIMFRRKLTAEERSDHSFLNEYMHVIWAKGQEQGKYSHRPASGIDDPNLSPSEPDFYREDELKYHGHAGQRSSRRINFLDEPSGPIVGDECTQTWRNPSDDSHEVTWRYDSTTDNVYFTLKATLSNRQWIGVGISRDAVMPNTDTIVGWINNDQTVTVIDGWASGRSMPVNDATQDIQGVNGSIVNGITTISFYRKRDTQDNSDIAFSDNDCVYLIYAKGGQYTAETGRYSRHDATPIVSSERVCMPCPTVTLSTSKPIGKFWVPFVLKLLGLPWADIYKDAKSAEFKNLKGDMEMALKVKFEPVNGMITVIIQQFSPGSIKVHGVVEIESADSNQGKNEVTTELNNIAQSGRLGGYTVDNTLGSYTVGDPESVKEITPAPPPPTEDKPLLPEAVWIIIGVAAAGLLVILILGTCNCIRMHRKNKNHYQDEEHKQLKLNGNGNHSSDNSSSKGNSMEEPSKNMSMGFTDWRHMAHDMSQHQTTKQHNLYENPSFISDGQTGKPPSYYYGYKIETYVNNK